MTLSYSYNPLFVRSIPTGLYMNLYRGLSEHASGPECFEKLEKKLVNSNTESLFNLPKFSVPDDEEMSDDSELSDNFEEFHRNSFLRPYADPKKKYLTKNEADRRIVEGFTTEFKKAMTDVRKELAIKDSLFDDEDAIEQAMATNKPINFDKNTDEIEPITIEMRPSRRTSEISEESNTWQVLQVNTTGKHFEISPPAFHAFHKDKPHWLERPEISWQVVDKSRLKCKQWLDECE